MKEAIGPLDLGEYKIDNVTKKVTMGEMTSFIQSKTVWWLTAEKAMRE